MQYETVTRPIYRGVVRSDANAILLISIDVLKGGSIGSIVKTVLAVVTIRIEEELWMCDITERMVCRHRGGWKWTAACLSQCSSTTAFTEGNNHCMFFFVNLDSSVLFILTHTVLQNTCIEWEFILETRNATRILQAESKGKGSSQTHSHLTASSGKLTSNATFFQTEPWHRVQHKNI